MANATTATGGAFVAACLQNVVKRNIKLIGHADLVIWLIDLDGYRGCQTTSGGCEERQERVLEKIVNDKVGAKNPQALR